MRRRDKDERDSEYDKHFGYDHPFTDAPRPFEEPGDGRLDTNGVTWYACDPYPTWYRWEDGELYRDPAEWADDIEYVTETEEYLEWRKINDRVREGARRRNA